METTVITLVGLFTKHFIIDFPLQTKFQYSNKGKYGHPGGLIHAWLHGLGTFIVLSWVTPFAIILSLVDIALHYHIDYLKMKLNAKLGYGPTTHEQFWWLLGFDQYLHALTYLLFASIIH